MKMLNSTSNRNPASSDTKTADGLHHLPRAGDRTGFLSNASTVNFYAASTTMVQDYRAASLASASGHSRGGEAANYDIAGIARPVGGSFKRCFDISVAATTLMVMAPIMLLIALLILVTMGRPILFVQQRVGFRKSLFGCFKFRTMVPDAQDRLMRYLATNTEAAHRWRETQKLKHDPRITWLGQILRKSSLDELPQLLNVLRGDMSCIGPRPVLVSELQRYGEHAGDYVRAKPGLTGMWQVSGRSNTTYAHRIKCDRYYVRRWSPYMDAGIIARTIPAIFRFKDTG